MKYDIRADPLAFGPVCAANDLRCVQKAPQSQLSMLPGYSQVEGTRDNFRVLWYVFRGNDARSRRGLAGASEQSQLLGQQLIEEALIEQYYRGRKSTNNMYYLH